MRRLFLALFAAALLPLTFSCQEDQTDPVPDCTTPATIRDLRGLDGCGFVLELDNGQRLEPHGTLWQNYAKHDGERVTIDYTSTGGGSICMVGQIVQLTCIQQQMGRCGTVAPGKAN